MFNVKFNLNNTVMDLYPNIRKQVLFSMVGSLNATIVGAADKLAVRLEMDGYDFKELGDADYVQLLTGPDDTDGLSLIRLQCSLANEWRDALRYCDSRDNADLPEIERAGSIYSTLNMMTGVQRVRPEKSGARALLKSIGVEVTAAQVQDARAAAQAADQARANARAQRKAAIATIIETVFDTADNGDTDYFVELPEQQREQLVTKFFAALNGAATKATNNVLMGVMSPDALGVSDIMLIRDVAARVMAEAYPPTPAPKPATPETGTKAKRVRRAPGPLKDALVQKLRDDRLEAESNGS